ARAVVARRLSPCQRCLALRLEVFRRAVAPERRTGLEQPGGGVAVERTALALAVRSHRPLAIRPLDARTLLPVQAQPQQVLDHLGLGARDVPLDVGVLDSQHEHTAVLSREEPVQHRDPRVAHVQAAGGARRWRKAWTCRASVAENPGTCAISSGVAARTPRTLPNRSSSAFCRAGPMPGISRNSLASVRRVRSLRLYPIANRCASLRIRW